MRGAPGVAMGAKVLLFWGPGEEAFVNAVRAEMTYHALPDYPVPDLLQMAALLERCHLYVGNDNGPRHFAIAVGTPTVAVFGRPFPENWTPPGEPLHQAVTWPSRPRKTSTTSWPSGPWTREGVPFLRCPALTSC